MPLIRCLQRVRELEQEVEILLCLVVELQWKLLLEMVTTGLLWKTFMLVFKSSTKN